MSLQARLKNGFHKGSNLPELPEVETNIRLIRPFIWGSHILGFVQSKAGRQPEVSNPQLRGQAVHHVGRWGKYIIFKLGNGYLISHLRMTGQWHFTPVGCPTPYTEPHFRWAMTISDQENSFSGFLWFRDARRFGTLDWTPTLSEYKPFSNLGPDGLTLDDPKVIFGVIAQAAKSRRPIKNFLLDQSVIAGCGNIYCSEILFELGVDPTTRTMDLGAAHIEELCLGLHQLFVRAIEQGGSSVSDYLGGRYHELLKVYKRDGEPCFSCGATIKRMVQAGRSTFYCPKCQGVGNEYV